MHHTWTAIPLVPTPTTSESCCAWREQKYKLNESLDIKIVITKRALRNSWVDRTVVAMAGSTEQ